MMFVTAIRRKLVTHNPVIDLIKLRMKTKQTDYLNREELSRFLEAIDDPWLRALVLLLRWSGLRISDALNLERGCITNGVLMLHQQKTGTSVSIPLPPEVLDALAELPHEGGRYFYQRRVTYLEKRFVARQFEKVG
jgi:integrase/recombinase XerD